MASTGLAETLSRQRLRAVRSAHYPSFVSDDPKHRGQLGYQTTKSAEHPERSEGAIAANDWSERVPPIIGEAGAAKPSPGTR